MIPKPSKLLGNLAATSSPLLKTIQNSLSSQVRKEGLLLEKCKNDVVLGDTQVRSNSCFTGENKSICAATSLSCNKETNDNYKIKMKPLSTEFCGFSRRKEKPCPPEVCIQRCCPVSCRTKDPCCPDKCAKVECPPEDCLKCCNKRPCCPNDDYGRSDCCKEKAPEKVHRCDQPGACDDPCCSRTPICPKSKCGVECDEFLGDSFERPCPIDPCDVNGNSCNFASNGNGNGNDDCCEDKSPKDACDVGLCPRKEKCKKKKRNGNQICLNLDPNWPPKRPQCHGEPEKDPCTPCQRDCKRKQKFDDGLC